MTDQTKPSHSAHVVELKAAKKAAKKGAKCPICAKTADAGYLPFCSKRCADIDLGRWLGESYRIPTEEAPDPYGSPEDENG